MFKFIRRMLVLAVFLFAGYKAYLIRQDVKQVMTYQPMVREILNERDTPANEELVLAMIYTETKGKEGDVMQSSESASGSGQPFKLITLDLLISILSPRMGKRILLS